MSGFASVLTLLSPQAAKKVTDKKAAKTFGKKFEFVFLNIIYSLTISFW
jgi:hypothetical protein